MFKFLTFLVLSFSSAYAQVSSKEPLVVEGKTMGTTYRVLYFDGPRYRDFSSSVDSLLIVVNKAINTYDPSSEISRFNRSDKGIRTKDFHFRNILKRCADIYKGSGGAFDPTVMPLVNAWGFGPGKSFVLSQEGVDSLKKFIGFDKIRVTKKKVRKKRTATQLDMGGIGQGYGADVIFKFLKTKGVDHMLVELGGEGIASGKNLTKDKPWTIGILDPNSTPEDQFFKAYVSLEDQAFTTSGNYFNYRVINGRKLGHTINPSTGFPVQHSLLSASVFAPDCTTADGWATAFMVMGIEKAKSIVTSIKGMEAIFMYSDEEGRIHTHITPGINKQVTLE